METIWLQRPSGDIPWGFRLQGGREFAEPLSVQRVTPGTVAAGNLSPGDLILKIGNVNATNITHNEAQEVITGATNILQLTIKKSGLTSAPLSPTSAAPQYSSPQQIQNQYSSPQDQSPFPDYRVGSGYQGYNVNNSDGYNYAQENSARDPYDMRQFEQTPPISGYSTLPARGGNRQNSESFRPVQQQNQNKYPYKSTTGIQLQINPQSHNEPRDDYQRSYNDSANYSQSQPMSPVNYMNGDSNYQRQTSVGTNRSDTNNGYPSSYFKKPTPFSSSYNNQNGSSTPPPRLQRQTSHGSVHDSTISQGFRPPTIDDAPPPPPPPTNYQPEQYRRASYDQDVGRPQYQRQTSNPSYNSSPYDQRSNDYNQYQNQSQQYEHQGSRPFEHDSTPPHYQRQTSNPQYYGERNEPSFQRQASYGSQQQQQPPPPPQGYGSPYTPPQSYGGQQAPQQFNRQSSRDQQQQAYNRQNSRDQHIDQLQYPTSPPGSTINSFDDILSPFENFQNSNYCDKLFARDNRGDGDSGVVSDLNSDTPRSNMSSNYSSYSPPQQYPGGYNSRGEVQQPQTLLRPAPQAPPPPPVTPPPPPPPPPPSDWAPTPKRKVPALQDQQGGGEAQMPDKVLNTMLKNKGTQKPFAYVPTGTDLKEFKERARARRQPRPVMPRGYVGPALDDDSAAEPQQPQTSKSKPGAMPNPDSGVYKHAQYNSPLRMYSSDSAKEQFNIQSGGNVDVTGVNQSNNYQPKIPPHFIMVPQKTVRTPEKPPSDIKESEVYKMCQAADAKGKETNVSDFTQSEAEVSRDPVSCDPVSRVDRVSVPLDQRRESQERVFSPPPGAPRGQGLSFRVLQWLTDTADDDQIEGQESYKPKKPRDPLLRHNSEDDEMRFSGLHTKADLPSKAFHRLNKMVGSDNLNTGSNQTNNRGNDENNASSRTISDDEDDGMPDRLNEEDMVDKRYTGAHIPSKSFKALQMYMDDDKTGSEGDTGGPKIKVISRAKSPKIAPKPDRPVNSPVPQPKEAPSTDF
ncbi:trithorax group protein osa-like isoform X4 [Ruditapes philippinarum]|uniref:trithorax group protein osa-like isoform X4 n=1 Tax=Ruditapes philippinarum TaxID=129788 RepID=UPI00295C292D|nr:trithorax group protein osa-like isoform X4 [Ruditapes philippinarum]